MSCGCGSNKQQAKSKPAPSSEAKDPCESCPCDEEDTDCCNFENPPCGPSNTGCSSNKGTLQQQYQQNEKKQNGNGGKPKVPGCQCGGGSNGQPPAPRKQSATPPVSKPSQQCQGSGCTPAEPCTPTTNPSPTIDDICQQYGENENGNAKPCPVSNGKQSKQSECGACGGKKSASKEPQPQQSGGCGCDGKPANNGKQPQQSGGCGCDGKPANNGKQPQQSGGCGCSKNSKCPENQNGGKCSGGSEAPPPSCGIKNNNKKKNPPPDPAQMKQVIAPCCFGKSNSIQQIDDDEGPGCPCGTRTKLTKLNVEEPECPSCFMFGTPPETEPEPRC